MTISPRITIAVPSYNQGRYLDAALTSIFDQGIAIEVFVLDGGSTDDSIDVIRKWEGRLAGWRSHPDQGQAAAINEGVAAGSAPFVGWLNSDDLLLPGGFARLLEVLEANAQIPIAYGRAWDLIDQSQKCRAVWVEPFSARRLALRCIIAQPATLIRRSAWERVGGVDERLHMAMDYDLWWRLFKEAGEPQFVDSFVAVNRIHAATKTKTQRRLHYREAIQVVRKHYGRAPLKWWLAQPYAVWLKALMR